MDWGRNLAIRQGGVWTVMKGSVLGIDNVEVILRVNIYWQSILRTSQFNSWQKSKQILALVNSLVWSGACLWPSPSQNMTRPYPYPYPEHRKPVSCFWILPFLSMTHTLCLCLNEKIKWSWEGLCMWVRNKPRMVVLGILKETNTEKWYSFLLSCWESSSELALNVCRDIPCIWC